MVEKKGEKIVEKRRVHCVGEEIAICHSGDEIVIRSSQVRQRHGQADKQTDIQAVKHSDRQTNRETYVRCDAIHD